MYIPKFKNSLKLIWKTYIIGKQKIKLNFQENSLTP